MIGVELAPLPWLERAEVPEAADRLLDQLISREQGGMLNGPVVHGDEEARTLGARFFIEAESWAEAVRRTEAFVLRDLVAAIVGAVGAERVPVGTTLSVEGVELEPALRHIVVDVCPWPESGVA